MGHQRSCPICGINMEYRLGEYWCVQCDHVEKEEIEHVPDSIKKARQLHAESGIGPQSLSSTIEHYQRDVKREIGKTYPSLPVEKHIYFALGILTLITYGFFPNMPDTTLQQVPIGGRLFILGFAILALWYVLYTTHLWAKWTFGTVSLLEFILLLAVVVYVFLKVDYIQHFTNWYGMGQALFIILLFASFCVVLWFFFIMYRDIHILHSG